MQPDECRALLVQHLEWIWNAMARLCRRYEMTAVDADDFSSWATLRLVEGDYQIIRKFRGESQLRTYLSVVLAMLHREYRVKHWGRWRPSAAARRSGPVAVELERLIDRDGLSVAQAVLVMQTRRDTALSGRELTRLALSLPSRRLALVDTGLPADDAVAPSGADELVVAADAADRRRAVEQALDAALSALADEDRNVLRMRFWDGMTVAEIARALGLPQKPLYRRLLRVLDAVRLRLEANDVSSADALTLLAER